ncbi:MAG: TetR/AcrR family transcriptional regulator [Jatrophihabitantaceae bacterium]
MSHPSQPVKPQRMRGNRPAYTTETLLEVAVTVFTTRGYDGTSMEDLAAAAGLSKSSIYHHVQGKQQLLALALDRALDGLFAVLTRPGATTGPAVDRLTHVIRGTVGVLLDELPYVTLLLRVRGNSPTELAALARRREFDQLVAHLVLQAQQQGDVDPGLDAAIATRLIFGMINSLTEWYRPSRADQVDLPETLVQLVLTGLAPR